jgi:anti-anti-sigma factor
MGKMLLRGSEGRKAMNEGETGYMTKVEGVLRPIGDLTIFEAAQFHEDLNTLQQQEGPLALDLTDVVRMDSSCVQLIVAATRSGRLTLKGYSTQIRDRFERIGFAQFLPVVPEIA